YRLLPRDLERHSASLLDHLRRETLALLRRRAGFDAHAWQARQQHRIAQLGALHGMEDPRSALALRLGFVSLQLARETRHLWRALAGLDPATAEARWIERTLRAIAVRHRDPPLAARHARRTGARLAAAGEW
ncbi:FUSC family protein, partial [Escherichia coli]|nr:FUSC family protein [Escherichia coli]